MLYESEMNMNSTVLIFEVTNVTNAYEYITWRVVTEDSIFINNISEKVIEGKVPPFSSRKLGLYFGLQDNFKEYISESFVPNISIMDICDNVCRISKSYDYSLLINNTNLMHDNTINYRIDSLEFLRNSNNEIYSY